MAKVVSVNISREKGVIKTPVDLVVLTKDHGLEQDAHAGDWHRQVSLLGIESVEKIKEMGMDNLSPGVFAENILTQGIVLHQLPVGTWLRVGETIHEVTQIGKECHQRCEIFHTVGDCVMPREGIFTRVIQGGRVKAGDVVEVMETI